MMALKVSVHNPECGTQWKFRADDGTRRSEEDLRGTRLSEFHRVPLNSISENVSYKVSLPLRHFIIIHIIKGPDRTTLASLEQRC